jgi:putative transposase
MTDFKNGEERWCILRRMWINGLKLYDEKVGIINWKWQSMDGWCNYKGSSWGGKSTGPNPTDRAKSGTKRSLLVDGQGIPIGITVDCANRHMT